MKTYFLSRVETRWGAVRLTGCALALMALAGFAAGTASAENAYEAGASGENVHEALYNKGEGGVPYYPSASECKQCHPDHYKEWSVSPHAYAQLSPVFNAMHAKILKLTNGTNGDFCIRCHTPIGMNIEEDIFMSNIDRTPASREGITCVACHRVTKPFGKISGRFALADGDLAQIIYGPRGNPEFQEQFGNEIDEKFGEGKVHGKTEPFYQLVESAFCGTCHDVNLLNGFRLEEAFSDFKQSPAARNGVTCQDCHMGVNPGVFTGDPATNYDFKQIAKIGAVYVGEPQKKTNHMMSGPDHSVIHPGLYPHNDDMAQFATMREWLTFDYQAGWGTEEFEEEEEPARIAAGQGTLFPPRWDNIDERYAAREYLYDQFALLEEYQEARLKVLKAGYGIGDYKINRASTGRGIDFTIEVKNLTDGHSVPTGFIAERVVYLEVEVRDAAGELVYVSGDLDPNFDVRDLHSLYVHNRELSLDRDLFSLQSQFITRNERGGEREQVLAINFSPSPLPFLRPSDFAATLTGRPGGARIHRKTITALGSRWPSYRVGKKRLTGAGTYTVNVRLIAGMVPINLVNEIKDVGFDYGMSAHEVAMGVRFGVGDVIDSEGNRHTRKYVENLMDEGRESELGDLFGATGGHSLLDTLEFKIVVE